MRLSFEFIVDFLHDAMKHNIDKIGRRQIVPQHFQLFLGAEDREMHRQYENVLIEELIYALKTIRDDYFKDEQDPIVVEIADDTELTRFEIDVAIRMVTESKAGQDQVLPQISSVQAYPPTTPPPLQETRSAMSIVTPAEQPVIGGVTDDDDFTVDDDQVERQPEIVAQPHQAAPPESEIIEDVEDDLDKRFRFMVDEARNQPLAKPERVVELAVNMTYPEDLENEIQVESEPAAYDDSLYIDEEDIYPEVLERLKRDRKFYEEWKARGRVPTLLSRIAAKQSERRMRHTAL